MGSGRFTANDWQSYTQTNTAGRSTSSIFSHRLDPDLDPKNIKIRESRDSSSNPNSTAVIVVPDVTGSMGRISDHLIREGLSTLFTEIYDRRPVTDPHIMLMANGDVAAGDDAPLQATQFEADIRIAQQLQKIWLVNQGGGNGSESYHLPWFFAANHTSIDCFEKRKKKGYLFTIGDDGVPPPLTRDQIERVFGYRVERDFSAADLLAMAERTYNVFHLIVEEGDSAGGRTTQLMADWSNLMGERAIRLTDHKKLAEVVVSTIQVHEGADTSTVIKSWSGDTSIVVANAVGGLAKTNSGSGLVRF